MEERVSYIVEDKLVHQGKKIILKKDDLLPLYAEFIDAEVVDVYVLLFDRRENEKDLQRIGLYVDIKCLENKLNLIPGGFIVTSVDFENRNVSLMSNNSIIWMLKEDAVQMIRSHFKLTFKSKSETSEL